MRDVGAHPEEASDFPVDASQISHASHSVSVLVVSSQQVLVPLYSLELNSNFAVVLSLSKYAYVALFDANRSHCETDIINLLFELILSVFYNQCGQPKIVPLDS